MNEDGLSQAITQFVGGALQGRTWFGWTDQFDWKHETCGSQR